MFFSLDLIDVVFLNPIGIPSIIIGVIIIILLIRFADKWALIYCMIASAVFVLFSVLGACLDGSGEWMYALFSSIPFAVGYNIPAIVYLIIKRK